MSETETADWLTRKETCQLLASLGYDVSPGRLANLAMNNNAGEGPPFYRFGEKVIRYKRNEVTHWIKSRMTRVA